eukprot:m.485304 g.485304  ORF g.485304 m.485304 type:complete len:64 (-) comp21733_c0_seq1:2285-2476(-)
MLSRNPIGYPKNTPSTILSLLASVLLVQSLVEKERQYYKSVKDYETECSKNELLIAKLKRRNK